MNTIYGNMNIPNGMNFNSCVGGRRKKKSLQFMDVVQLYHRKMLKM